MDAGATFAELDCGGRTYGYYSLGLAEKQGLRDIACLPFALKVVLENLLRQSASGSGRQGDIERLMSWVEGVRSGTHVQIRPARVMMDDTAGVPLIGELAAMRDAASEAGASATSIDLALPVDFVVDHSVIADHTGTPDALSRNMSLEMKRNSERFRLLRWAEQAFPKLRVVPPGRGICHQINLEYLARVVCHEARKGKLIAYPDTMIGIDSHTPMINGLGVVGWGVSGIEGLSAALGAPVAMQLPEVIGCRLTGKLLPGVTATDLVLTLTEKLRAHGVVGKVIEYLGPGVQALTVQDRSTVANMTPEAGATMSYFPIDQATVNYLASTGRPGDHLALVETYAKAQGLWSGADAKVPSYDSIIELDLSAVGPSVSGPRLPHQRVALAEAAQAFEVSGERSTPPGEQGAIIDGDIVIAAITSCTNTSNPALMVGAGLLARNAIRRGLKAKPWVKTSLSPGSRVVAKYLQASGLQNDLDELGFHVAGFGCMTCVGFSGPLQEPIASALREGVRGVAVLSGNRNYEGRAHPLIRTSFLASPPLVVAYALAGTMTRDIVNEPIGSDASGRAVYLAELWPDPHEIEEITGSAIEAASFTRAYANVSSGSAEWQGLEFQRGARFIWESESSFIRRPSTYNDVRLTRESLRDLHGARILAMYGDMVTTEHVSPMGPIPEGSSAARYLETLGIAPDDFVSYAARRLNEDVMARGTFASPHLRNEITPNEAGGMTRHMPGGTRLTIFEAAGRYRAESVPLVVIAGAAFGGGSSRDWSAKGPAALGVKAIIAESFERIYRANLVAVGVLPLRFDDGVSRKTLALDGTETVEIAGVVDSLAPMARLRAVFTRSNGEKMSAPLIACVETPEEVDQIRSGGLLVELLRERIASQSRPGVDHMAPSG